MILRLLFSVVFVLGLAKHGSTQDYSVGFRLLEEGSFQEALLYFDGQIKQGNTDFTAKLCFGRALGLSGSHEEAMTHFIRMKQDYSDNLELDLNYAESLMWSSLFVEARDMYKGLYKKNNKHFAIVLGYANSLSSLKNYQAASILIEEALAIDDKNENALISKKYIFLGLANQFKLSSKTKEAEEIYEELGLLFPNDIDVVLNYAYLKMDLNKLRDAEILLNKVLQESGSNYKLYTALARIKLRQFRYEKSLANVEKAKAHFIARNVQLPFDLLNLEFSIYLSKRSYEKAESILKQIEDIYGSRKFRDIQVSYLLNRKEYDRLEEYLKEGDRDFYYTTMTKINLAKGNFHAAKSNLDSVSMKPENQAIHYYLGKEISKKFYHGSDFGFEIMNDNGGTYAESYSVSATSSKKNKGRIYLGYFYRKAFYEKSVSASSGRFELGVNYQLFDKVSSQIVLANNALTNVSGDLSSSFQYAGKIKFDLSNAHFLSLSFDQNTFNYNVELINESITDNKIGLQYYNMFSHRLGAYFESNRSVLSDANNSNFVFLSFFNNFNTIPLLQAGVNYTYLRYKMQSSYYFSPKVYDVKEVFLKFDNSYHPSQSLIISATAGIGRQVIDGEDQQFTQRVEIELGYKFRNGQHVKAFYSYNNSASASLSGYRAQRMGVKASLRF